MVFSHSDANQSVVSEAGYSKNEQGWKKAKKRKKFEWKPFHLLLLIYSLMLVAGIALRMCN